MKDTLEILKKESDFKPLNSADAYKFINQYYLPRLDTLPTKRKIFIYALNGIDFKKIFKRDKAKLEKQYSGNAENNTFDLDSNPPLPPPIFYNKSFRWNDKRLLNTKVIADTTMSANNYAELRNITSWRSKYGAGYIWLSCPQYNTYTRRLVIREWVDDGDFFCGTGKLKLFWFTRIDGGWKFTGYSYL